MEPINFKFTVDAMTESCATHFLLAPMAQLFSPNNQYSKAARYSQDGLLLLFAFFVVTKSMLNLKKSKYNKNKVLENCKGVKKTCPFECQG